MTCGRNTRRPGSPFSRALGYGPGLAFGGHSNGRFDGSRRNARSPPGSRSRVQSRLDESQQWRLYVAQCRRRQLAGSSDPSLCGFRQLHILGQKCILCLEGQNYWNYDLLPNNGMQPKAIPKPYGAVYCNPNPDGTLGSCQFGPLGLSCTAVGVWNCNVLATWYGLQ